MTIAMLTWLGADQTPLPGPDLGAAVRGLVGVSIVLGLVVLFAWLLRRGTFGPLGRRSPSSLQVETALPLGERRSLVVVAVEGRRLLLGLTPAAVSLVAELQPAPAAATFTGSLDRAVGGDSQVTS